MHVASVAVRPWGDKVVGNGKGKPKRVELRGGAVG
jgi:hypothetical protein